MEIITASGSFYSAEPRDLFVHTFGWSIFIGGEQIVLIFNSKIRTVLHCHVKYIPMEKKKTKIQNI